MNNLRSLFFLAVIILSIFWNCSGERKNSLPDQISEGDKSVFFLTSKGGVWWWLRADKENKKWWLYISDAQSKQLLASTIFSGASATDFKFSFQQTGDKLWYISPEGKLEARNLLDGTVTENETVLQQKFPNLKSSITNVTEARPFARSGYFFTLLNKQEMYFDNAESLLMDRAALTNSFDQKVKTIKYLTTADTFEKPVSSCETKVFAMVSKNSYAYAGAPVGGWKLECPIINDPNLISPGDTINFNHITLNDLHKAPSFFNKDDLFALCVSIKEENGKQQLQLDCFDKRGIKFLWSKPVTELATAINTCEQIENNYSLSILKGEILIQETKSTNSAWIFKIADGSLSWQTNSIDLLNNIARTD